MPLDPASLKAAWDAKYAREPAPWRGPPELGALAPALAALPTGARVLELGAGGGKTLQAAAGAVALDWARDALRRLPGARVQADAARLPFREGAFDAVLAVHVLGHLPPAPRALAAREAARVLRPGGRLLFIDFAAGDMRAGKGDATPEPGSRVRDQGIHYHYFEPEAARLLFAGLLCETLEVEAKEERHRGERYERRLVRGAFLKPPA